MTMCAIQPSMFAHGLTFDISSQYCFRCSPPPSLFAHADDDLAFFVLEVQGDHVVRQVVHNPVTTGTTGRMHVSVGQVLRKKR